MSVLITNIKELLQVREASISKVSGLEMKKLPSIKNAFLYIENEHIIDFGSMNGCKSIKAETVIDATHKMVLPTWCDSHTHIVYAGNREQEFVDRIQGLSYEEIANRGGGILNSATKLQHTTENDLFEQSLKRVKEVMKLGTGALEIKSGYGLTLESELKMLRVIKRIKKQVSIPIKATFLGAHAFPEAYKNDKDGYINLIINEMLPKVSEERLADYIDVFCEKGYFSLEDSNRILSAGKQYGLIPKIHVNQFNAFGGVAMGVKHKALSVDHLEELNDDDILVLKDSHTMPVALPSCSYFLSIPYTPA
jgi:imidazolonepropionase